MGQVFKLQDLKLDRIVAGKVLRSDRSLAAPLRDFLREARSLALFKDRRIVQIFEFRADADPPVIIMEYVDGFELGRIGSEDEQRDCELVEFHCAPFEPAERASLMPAPRSARLGQADSSGSPVSSSVFRPLST